MTKLYLPCFKHVTYVSTCITVNVFKYTWMWHTVKREPHAYLQRKLCHFPEDTVGRQSSRQMLGSCRMVHLSFPCFDTKTRSVNRVDWGGVSSTYFLIYLSNLTFAGPEKVVMVSFWKTVELNFEALVKPSPIHSHPPRQVFMLGKGQRKNSDGWKRSRWKSKVPFEGRSPRLWVRSGDGSVKTHHTVDIQWYIHRCVYIGVYTYTYIYICIVDMCVIYTISRSPWMINPD